ncbi:MAG: hypothetical protein V2J51_17250 [Erythrobacter sp.]|jgi:hypothetical protein|nr:hypothetical protein [Erythrobacter sp.]
MSWSNDCFVNVLKVQAALALRFDDTSSGRQIGALWEGTENRGDNG